VRHVFLNVPHSAHPKISPYGESVGRYEGGDTLVVDTIGLSEGSYVDNCRTPHTRQLHVVERFQVAEGGTILQVTIRVEDPGAFYMPWSARQTYHRTRTGTLVAGFVWNYLIKPAGGQVYMKTRRGCGAASRTGRRREGATSGSFGIGRGGLDPKVASDRVGCVCLPSEGRTSVYAAGHPGLRDEIVPGYESSWYGVGRPPGHAGSRHQALPCTQETDVTSPQSCHREVPKVP
jgi:hypothetical protein